MLRVVTVNKPGMAPAFPEAYILKSNTPPPAESNVQKQICTDFSLGCNVKFFRRKIEAIDCSEISDTGSGTFLTLKENSPESEQCSK